MLQAEDRGYDIHRARVTTYEVHQVAIERVIQGMKEHLHESLTLEDMADIAYMSPYHFCRIFHQIIGIPPGEFLATLRLEAAKRLLLTTSLSVTDICYEVGYSGLGSFTTRFTQLVGLPPRLLRHLARNVDGPLLHTRQPQSCAVSCSRGLSGFISGPAAFSGSICAGLFPKPIPQGRPVACTMLFAPGEFHIDPVPDGRYYLLVAAFPHSLDPNAYLLPGEALLVGVQGPLDVQNGMSNLPVEVELRRHRVTDAPIIVALPFI